MSQRSNRLRLRSAANRGANVLLHLSLLLSLWQAPVPLIHSHDSIDQRTANTPFWAEHLDRFHAEPETSGEHGWHLHYVLPWELADKHDDAEHSREVPQSLRIESVQVASGWNAMVRSECDYGRVMVDQPSGVQPALVLSTTLSRPVGVQVLLTYSDRISWRALARVARC